MMQRMVEGVEKQHRVKEFFKAVVAPAFAEIRNDKLRGFCCLFFFYWHELFNNKDGVNEEEEPGIKQFLGIMSRIPFSELYDSLEEAEKGELRGILDPIALGMEQVFV